MISIGREKSTRKTPVSWQNSTFFQIMIMYEVFNLILEIELSEEGDFKKVVEYKNENDKRYKVETKFTWFMQYTNKKVKNLNINQKVTNIFKIEKIRVPKSVAERKVKTDSLHRKTQIWVWLFLFSIRNGENSATRSTIHRAWTRPRPSSVMKSKCSSWAAKKSELILKLLK